MNPPGGGGGDPNADPSSVYKFKFNGQELQSEYSLNVTAMDYRQYDHAIGRFNGMDLLAELSPDTSPYRFANNNPNFWSDPSGLVDLDVVEVPIPDRSFSSFSGNTNFGASIPQFFSWGRGASIDQGFPPLPSFLGVVSVNYDITKVIQQLEPVEVTVKSKSKTMKAGYLNGDGLTFYEGINIGIGVYGFSASHIESTLKMERKILLSKGTVTALSKIKALDISLTKIGKISKGLGVAGAGITAAKVGYDFYNGKDLTAGQIFDVGLSATLAVVAISNPIALVGFGIYGILDATGALDSIKESLGGNTVIYESPFSKY